MKLGLFDVTVWYDVVLSAKHETPRRYPLGNILFSAILDASLGLISKYHRDWIKAKGFILLIPFQHDCFLIQLSCWCFPVKICKIWSEKDSWQLPFNQSFPFISLTEISSPEKKRFSPQKAVERKRRAALLAPYSPRLFIPRHTGAWRTGRCSPASHPALPLPSSVLRTHFLLKLFFLFFFFLRKKSGSEAGTVIQCVNHELQYLTGKLLMLWGTEFTLLILPSISSSWFATAEAWVGHVLSVLLIFHLSHILLLKYKYEKWVFLRTPGLLPGFITKQRTALNIIKELWVYKDLITIKSPLYLCQIMFPPCGRKLLFRLGWCWITCNINLRVQEI